MTTSADFSTSTAAFSAANTPLAAQILVERTGTQVAQ